MKGRRMGIALSYVNSVTGMLSGLVLSVVLLRVLGDTEYGVYQTISSFANYLILFEFGTGTVMTRNLSLCRSKGNSLLTQKNISTVWSITVGLSVVIALVSAVFYASIGAIYAGSMTSVQISYGKKIFFFVAVYLIASFYDQTMNGVLLAYEAYTLSSALQLAKTLTKLVVLLALIHSLPYAILIAIVDMTISLVLCLYKLLYCKRKLRVSFSCKHFDKTILKEALPLCLALFLQTIVNQANNNVDKFIISVKMLPENVALYSVSLFVYNIYSSLSTIPISMYAPQITRAVGEGYTRAQLADILVPPSRLICLVGGTVFFGFISAGRQFIAIAYGESYLEAWVIAVVIMAPMYFNMANGVLVNVLNAENKRMPRSCILVANTVANIVLTVFWVGRWGMVGAAAATAVTTVFGQVILMNLYYARVLKIPVISMLRRTLRGILPQQLGSTALALLAAWKIENLWLSFFVSGGTYVAAFALLYLCFGATPAEKAKLKGLVRRKHG